MKHDLLIAAPLFNLTRTDFEIITFQQLLMQHSKKHRKEYRKIFLNQQFIHFIAKLRSFKINRDLLERDEPAFPDKRGRKQMKPSNIN